MGRRLNYANVTATLALFFAISGGALAAKHYLINSTKQINPKVLKALEGTPGKEGPVGKEGPAGKNGANGGNGTDGANGTALAYAHVVWNGITASFDASQTFGMGTATVTKRLTSVFCFAGLPFTAKNAQVTADFGHFATETPHAQVQILAPGAKALNCSAGENVEVITSGLETYEPWSFYILFN